MNEPETLQQADSTHVLLRKRRLLFFAGCDYFRLSCHPKVKKALTDGLRKFGLSVAASRLTTGNHPLYLKVEHELAKYFGAPNATVVSTGYLADLVAAEAMAGEFSHAVLDSAAHPALRRAADLLECPVVTFASQKPAELAAALKRCGPGSRPIVLTEGMFARDGSVAPLREYLRILPRDGMVLVDDAHGAGIVGKSGRGAIEHCGVGRARVVQTITLSKAFGVFGGAVLSDARLRRKIVETSPMFIGSTPAPLPLMNATLASLRESSGGSVMRARLRRNADQLKEKLRVHGFPIPQNPGPIVALCPANAKVKERVHQALLTAGIYPSLLRYPGGPKAGYFRFVISSQHSPKDIDQLARALCAFSPAELLPPVR